MGWLIALGILTLLAVLPLGVSVSYDQDGPLVRVIIGPIRLKVYPGRKKAETQEPCRQQPENENNEPQLKKSAAPARKGTENPGNAEGKKGGPVTDFLPLVRIALEMLDHFRCRLRVNLLELKLVLAADDPCDLAVNYGRAWAAVGNLMPRLERVLAIKKRDIDVSCDFEASQTLIAARLDLTITLGRLLVTVSVYGIRALIEFLKIKNKRKGGVSK